MIKAVCGFSTSPPQPSQRIEGHYSIPSQIYPAFPSIIAAFSLITYNIFCCPKHKLLEPKFYSFHIIKSYLA